MANLGALTLSFSHAESGALEMPRTTANSFNPKYTRIFDTPCNGTRSGVVTLNEVPIERVVVRLHWRDNGAVIEQQFTKADGSYIFKGLDPTAAKRYMVTVLDPNESSPFNYTLTQDHLTAVPE